MPIDFSQLERGTPFAGNYAAEVAALQARVAQLHLAQIVHKKRMIVLYEGWVGSGKTQALKALCASLSPCHTKPYCVPSRVGADDERHWFAPFWQALPAAGETSLFFRSWYSRAALARLSGELDDKAWQRAFDEINEFENQQREHGTVLVKLFFHVSADEQKARIRAQLEDPWLQHLLTDEEIDRVNRRAEIDPVVAQLYDATDTRWAPWTPIDAADPEAANIAMLKRVVAAMEKDIPAEPPAALHGAEVVDLNSRRRG